MSVEDRGTAGVTRWHFKFMHKGVIYSGPVPSAKDGKKAREYEEKKRAEVILGLYDKTEPGTHDFCNFVDKVYLTYARENKETWRHDEFRCEVIKECFRGKRFCDFTPLLIVKFINERLESKTVRKELLETGKVVNRRRSPATVRKEFVLLSSIFNMAVDEEVAVKNPCRKVPKKVLKKIPLRNKRERFLTFEEEARLFDLGLTGPREHLRPLVKLALNTGVRRGGLLALERDHVNLGPHSMSYIAEIASVRRRIEIKPNQMLVVRNKGNKPYLVPLNQVARRVLEELFSDEAVTNFIFLNERTGRNLTEIKRGFGTACREAGIEDLTFHDLRHTFATRLKDAGADKITRRDLMGHAGADITDDYTHSQVETVQRAVDDLARYAGTELNKIRTNGPEQVRLRLVSA
jgi:integrase